ncbi:MAG: molybdopterin converting factor subunit 1 [Phycisphaeraceae bacterium]|nr:molybdopterin converting factor subunit 1 [Phycisphaeraceae bacterium]
MIHVRILLFAFLADDVGHRELDLQLDAGATVADAMDRLARDYRTIGAARDRIATAVNAEYVQADQILGDGDELALIPPVSGG